jgi:hypothetical protein
MAAGALEVGVAQEMENETAFVPFTGMMSASVL